MTELRVQSGHVEHLDTFSVDVASEREEQFPLSSPCYLQVIEGCVEHGLCLLPFREQGAEDAMCQTDATPSCHADWAVVRAAGQ